MLKQGIQRQHVFLVCLICAVSDSLLISLGISGFGAIVERFPAIEMVARIGGASFLVVYALFSFKSALFVNHALVANDEKTTSIIKTIAMCLAFTWLNPHVYLDTMILLGSISTQYQGTEWWFGLGAISASFCFFFSLGFGARLLAPVFEQPKAWRVLDFLVGLMMLVVAMLLILN